MSVFPEIVSAWKDMIFNIALGIVQNLEDAEEVTQDVFVKIYSSIGSFRKEAKLSTWIYQLTIRQALDFEKSKRRQKRGGLLKRVFNSNEAEDPVSFDHPGVKLDNKENAKLLFAAISRLPKNQRLAFLLHKMEGLTFEQIAGIMNISTTAVESLQGRAKQNLRKTLENYYVNNFKS
jgi:RNA polymerase sigma-70 factor (ECF subfamily)